MAMRFRHLILMAAVANGVALPGQAPVAAPPTAVELVKQIEAWTPALDSPGVTMKVAPLGTADVPGGRLARYALYLAGVPAGVHFDLVAQTVAQRSPMHALGGITLAADGRTICAGTTDTCGSPDKPGDPMNLAVTGASGEPIRFALISDDGRIKAFGQVTPAPDVGRDHDCGLEAMRALPHGELIIARGSGFPPGAPLEIASTSHGEHHTQNLIADGSGAFVAVIEPAQEGKSGNLALQARAAGCAPKVSIAWGPGSYLGR